MITAGGITAVLLQVYLIFLGVFTLTRVGTCSVLREPGRCTPNGENVGCVVSYISHPLMVPPWLHNRRLRLLQHIP